MAQAVAVLRLLHRSLSIFDLPESGMPELDDWCAAILASELDKGLEQELTEPQVQAKADAPKAFG